MAGENITALRLPFAEQIAFFRKKLNLGTEAWTDIWQAAHNESFVVAGAMRADLLADLRAAVDGAIADGATRKAFLQEFGAIVEKYGWDHTGGRAWRANVIYETNLRGAYQAGRRQQMRAVADTRPYWRYVHSIAVQDPRPEHLAWDGLVLAADDPWWNTHYPPNGWGCQCTVETLGPRDLDRLGLGGPQAAPEIVWREQMVGVNGPSPRLARTPDGIDPGFAYAPG